MSLEHGDHIIQIAETAGRALGRDFEVSAVRWAEGPHGKRAVADAPSIFLLSDTNSARGDSYLFVSNPTFPDFVAESARNAQEIRSHLPQSLGSRVLVPTFQSRYRTRSFAVYPRLRPVSQNRIVRKLQVAFICSAVREWLCAVNLYSRQSDPDERELGERFLEPLEFVASERRFSKRLRDRSESAIVDLKSRSFNPVLAIQHGDFWIGNILLERTWPAQGRGEFTVIDWGGAQRRGYPFMDLLRFFASFTSRKRTLRRSVQIYADRCGLDSAEVVHYACASIGWLGLNRHQFPEDRYLMHSEWVFELAEDLS